MTNIRGNSGMRKRAASSGPSSLEVAELARGSRYVAVRELAKCEKTPSGGDHTCPGNRSLTTRGNRRR
jgi:hypothetical protein